MTQKTFTIGTLAQKAGVHVETIRFYQRRGLLAEPEKPLGGIRRYTQADVLRVGFIKEAQKLGFSLREIAELLELEDGCRCREAREVALRKLAGIRERIESLQRMERALVTLVERCGGADTPAPCPIIAALQGSS
jgi:MerR family mercuric resistance operon transcriptional regulator